MKDGVTPEDAMRVWETQAAPLLKQVDGVSAVYSMANTDTREAVTIVVYETKAAADAFAQGPLRDQVVGTFKDVVDGMSVTEFDAVFDLTRLTR